MRRIVMAVEWLVNHCLLTLRGAIGMLLLLLLVRIRMTWWMVVEVVFVGSCGKCWSMRGDLCMFATD